MSFQFEITTVNIVNVVAQVADGKFNSFVKRARKYAAKECFRVKPGRLDQLKTNAAQIRQASA
jgi:hypothetical protein